MTRSYSPWHVTVLRLCSQGRSFHIPEYHHFTLGRGGAEGERGNSRKLSHQTQRAERTPRDTQLTMTPARLRRMFTDFSGKVFVFSHINSKS
jgi:hypothetical protein